MPAAEDRQAKALEEISRNTRELTKIMATMNENFVAFGKIFKEALTGIVEAEQRARGGSE